MKQLPEAPATCTRNERRSPVRLAVKSLPADHAKLSRSMKEHNHKTVNFRSHQIILLENYEFLVERPERKCSKTLVSHLTSTKLPTYFWEAIPHLHRRLLQQSTLSK